MDGAKDEGRRPAGWAGALYMLFGPIVWAGHLAIVYAGHAVPCAKGVASAGRLIPYGIELATIMALAALLVAILGAAFRLNRSGDSARSSTMFQDKVMIALALLSAIGIAWAGTSALIVEPCRTLR